MGDRHSDLDEIIQLNRAVRPAEAAKRFERLIGQLSEADLTDLDADLQAALASFLPKRRKGLAAALAARRAGPVSQPPAPPAHVPVGSAPPLVPLNRLATTPRPVPPSDRAAAARVGAVAPARPVPSPPPAALPPVAPITPAQAVPARSGTPRPAGGDIAARLAEIRGLLHQVKPGEAEDAVRALVAELGDDALRAHSSALYDVVDRFLPKRRRQLVELLDEALSRVSPPEPVASGVTPTRDPSADDTVGLVETPAPVHLAAVNGVRPATPSPSPAQLMRSRPRAGTTVRSGGPVRDPDPAYMNYRFTEELDNLSRSHIFQWATFYRDVLSEYFEAFLMEVVEDDRSQVPDITKSALMHHARDIFSKGYSRLRTTQGFSEHHALNKSLSGLQRFLDLPLELYSSRLADAHRDGSAWSLRRLCSAMLFGILHGYSDVRFELTGRQILPRFPRSWAYVLPFLTSEDLHELSTLIEPGQFHDGVADSVFPLVEVVDKLLRADPSRGPLPALSQYVGASRRLDVSLRPALNASDARPVEVQCYLLADFVERHHIEEALSRAVSVVIAPLRPDMRARVAAVERLAKIVVPTGGLTSDVSAVNQLTELLEGIIWETAEDARLDRPINYNFALGFPIENPFYALTYNHVYRHSVRNLMNSFERRNGVRLWCSVRRSGKTTACAADLGSTTGTSVVITQTCDDTGQVPDGGVFYGRVLEALDGGQRLPAGFVMKTVAECLTGQATNAARFVLVLDEYETLFGQLSSYLVSRPELRYLIVQPLLNQLVEFTRDNLLVFVGQQPNAHFILLDQNQLSPVVEQDSFPLFTHDASAATSGEFYELVHKVMSNYVDLEPEFVTMVYRETGGHPFLTVKLLVAFMEWLINNRYPVSHLHPVRAELFAAFARENLTSNKIAFSEHYDFFKAAAAAHLSARDRRENPWLHSVYSILRALCLESPTTLSCTEDEYNMLAAREQITSPTHLLTTARAANFLAFDGDVVRPRIPLLARIAAAVTPV
ncbi:hypothetical protein [Micromonospora sp. NPDC051006]|uniref:hypothetical protein n=1 Tax=Micromonospora sp. NPDC051006 TaxID=3364283 RepID=UPI00378D2B61